MSSATNSQRPVPDDTKPRRSTKLSGKLKVLPEQPEPGPVPTKRALLAPAQGGEGSNATGDSDDDDGDGGPDEDETEDVDVRLPLFLVRLFLLMLRGCARLASPKPTTPYPSVTHCWPPKQVYNQIARMPAGTARRDALRLTKKKAKSLPRVTAYATAG
jgi:hypothetical protein